MNINEYQKVQQDIIDNTVKQEVCRHPEDVQRNMLTHNWFMDPSDMVWECTLCLALLHTGKRRFNKCSHKWGE